THLRIVSAGPQLALAGICDISADREQAVRYHPHRRDGRAGFIPEVRPCMIDAGLNPFLGREWFLVLSAIPLDSAPAKRPRHNLHHGHLAHAPSLRGCAASSSAGILCDTSRAYPAMSSQ